MPKGLRRPIHQQEATLARGADDHNRYRSDDRLSKVVGSACALPRRAGKGRGCRRRASVKTVLIQELNPATSPRSHGGLYVPFCGVGDASREGNDLWLEMKEVRVLDIDDASCSGAG